MKKLKLYLAHNLDTRKEIRKIELQIEKEFNIELLNPFYDVPRDDIQKIDKGISTRWEISLDRCKAIVKRDLDHILNCDGILAIIIKPSIGTTLEIGFAKHHNKKIFIISEIYSDHPWIKVYADHKFKTLKDFKRYLNSCNFWWEIKKKYMSKK